MAILNTSLLKESIFENLQKQLEELTNLYESKINNINKEKQILLEENLHLKTIIHNKEATIIKLEKNLDEITKNINALKKRNSDQVLESEIIDYYSLDLLEKYIYNNDCKNFASYLKKIDISEYSQVEVKKLTGIFLIIFNYKFNDNNSKEEAYRNILYLLKNLIHSNEAKLFLFNNYRLINDSVIELSNSYIISELAKIYYNFMLSQIQVSYLKDIIEKWKSNSQNIDIYSFTIIYWMSFIHNLELNLLKAIKAQYSIYLKQNIAEIKIISTYKKIMNNRGDLKKDLAEISDLKNKFTLFDKEEQKRLFKILDKRIRKIIKANNEESIHSQDHKLKSPNNILQSKKNTIRKMGFVVELMDEEYDLYNKNSNLSEEWIELSTYRDKSLRGNSSYTLVKVLSHNKLGKAYVTPKILQEIKSIIGTRNFIEIRTNEGNVSTSFKWPSTELNGNPPIELQDKVLFNDESELKKIGYQITGLSKEKRWTLLEKAVHQIGLRKVAYTIAQNVKLRKGQKNGLFKFKHAITEWEYDLNKLRRTYYKNDFIWPSTKLN